MSNQRCNAHRPPVRVPSPVRVWYRIHAGEGIHADLAFRRAVERAFCAGEISEATASRLEQALNAGELDSAAAGH